jgi:hypothetical protein
MWEEYEWRRRYSPLVRLHIVVEGAQRGVEQTTIPRLHPPFSGFQGAKTAADIVASASDRPFLIDVKRYEAQNPATVELVRRVHGVAEAVDSSMAGTIVREAYHIEQVH